MSSVTAPPVGQRHSTKTQQSNGDAPESLVRGMVSLNSKLDLKQLELLNATDDSSVRSLFEVDSKAVIESDSDEQLMIYAPFQESIKAHTIVIRANEVHFAPSQLRLYVNRPNILSFDDVDSLPATQCMNEISYDDKGVALVTLRFVKFQKVNSIVIFVERNIGGGEVTKLCSIEFLGEVSPTNSSGIVQKVEHDHD